MLIVFAKHFIDEWIRLARVKFVGLFLQSLEYVSANKDIRLLSRGIDDLDRASPVGLLKRVTLFCTHFREHGNPKRAICALCSSPARRVNHAASLWRPRIGLIPRAAWRMNSTISATAEKCISSRSIRASAAGKTIRS